MLLTEWQMAAHPAAALGLGAVIGLERQWRARLAGLRTKRPGGERGRAVRAALAVRLPQRGLGGGVRRLIMRDGLSVRGLNAAATPWCSAGVGCLAGVGLFVLAVCGTAGVVGANVLPRPLGRRVDREPRGWAEVATDYHFEAVCRPGYPLRSIRRCRLSAGRSCPHDGARRMN
ncbi:MgtC/SapB family protein [Streptomyces sp. NBC_00273]|uniref:MgtC/SapB family protein n=1 Tax=Streptomyces sp. NBC_00273 TaxID=2903644 RepID=UPI002E2E0778|nr:MgtC/SapB family protein [Streptomyces sp. NBC_00273]